MVDVNREKDLPETVIKELERVVIRHCMQLHIFERLMGTEERGKEVALFMKKWVGEVLAFNVAERMFIIKFMKETEDAVQESLSRIGYYDNPLDALRQKLNDLIAKAEELSDLVEKKGGE
jgi:hypothetical protein